MYVLEHGIIRFRLTRRELSRAVDGRKQRTYFAVVLEESRCSVRAGLPSGDEEGPVRALLQKDLAQQHVSCLAMELRQKVDEMALVIVDVVPDPRGFRVHPVVVSTPGAPAGLAQLAWKENAGVEDVHRGSDRHGGLVSQ